ncbi:ATP-binding protein [Candidatus Parcubacteria bacterium]|nr:ATP-binding protein [Candidatus Parcubacteria bacterium]
MKIYRSLLSVLEKEFLESNKIIVLYGARQTGKTTLSNDILKNINGKILKINADELSYTNVLSSRDLGKLKLLTGGYDVLFIDEAQRIEDIGINLKIIHDNIPQMKLLVTGSSSLDLANKVKEPLTGRTSTYTLLPISLMELAKTHNIFELQNRLEEFMVYGMYPDIFSHNSYKKKEKYLRELSGSYLYKDILDISQIRNTSKIKDLLRLLAFQIASEVSLNELGSSLGLSLETVNAYINLLEKSFIVFRLGGFSRNLRKEISKRDKIYFWDLGIRNTLINNFSAFEMRNDVGAMWENFIISERIKYLSYNEIFASSYFWRTYTGAELDYVEEISGQLYAYEIKYKKVKLKAPKTWTENYSNNYKCITIDNFGEFVV